MKSEQINELMTALALAQGKFKPVRKNSENPFFKSNYADLASCLDGIREALSEQGLAVTQFTESHESSLILVTMLAHKSGQFITGEYPIDPTKKDPQGYGAAMTYARRYSLCGIVGIAAEDDDGNEASGKTEPVIQRPGAAAAQPASSDPQEVLYEGTVESVTPPSATAKFKVYKVEFADKTKAGTYEEETGKAMSREIGCVIKTYLTTTAAGNKTFIDFKHVSGEQLPF